MVQLAKGGQSGFRAMEGQAAANLSYAFVRELKELGSIFFVSATFAEQLD